MNLEKIKVGGKMKFAGGTLTHNFVAQEDRVGIGSEEVKETWFTSSRDLIIRCRAFLGFK